MADPANAPDISPGLPLPSPIRIFDIIHLAVIRRLRLSIVMSLRKGRSGRHWLPISEHYAIAWRPEELRQHYDELTQRP